MTGSVGDEDLGSYVGCCGHEDGGIGGERERLRRMLGMLGAERIEIVVDESERLLRYAGNGPL